MLNFCLTTFPFLINTIWLINLKLFRKIAILFFDFFLFFLPSSDKVKFFYVDLKTLVRKKLDFIWILITKHRFMYILRLSFLIFVLYRPTLLDLDSLYWTLSILFYFVSNNFFFLSSYINPLTDWVTATPSLKFLSFFLFFPALYSSKKLRRRLMKKKKIVLKDPELFFIFQWAQRIFIFTFYISIFYLFFFLISIVLPLFYVFFFDANLDFLITPKLIYFAYLRDLKYFYLLLHYFFNFNFIFFPSYFFIYLCKAAFLFLDLYIFSFIKEFFIILYLNLFSFFVFLKYLFLSFFKIYFFLFFSGIKTLSVYILFLKNFFFFYFDLKNVFEVFKNFLFSDNFIIFLFWIFEIILSFLLKLIFSFIKIIFFYFNFIMSFFIPESVVEGLRLNFHFLIDFLLSCFYFLFTKLLDNFIIFVNTYLKNLSFFGLISTWYEYLNQGVQRGISHNSFLNWMFVHLYASIIAFWFLDFDFRVSVKTPPKTPNTLLREAKRTQEWIPQNMDFLTLQTNEAKIYFAMLDISFEHVESLQFIYGDFEYIDEEYDMEDETPDEEEFFNESDETLKVREIIESDLGFTKRPTKMTDDDPLDSKSNLERHYLGEIVGEPELIYIEEPIKWAFEALYSPTFEDLHFKDSLFSEWVFDPDEDLTFFEFLLLLPFLFFLVYVWFFHRRRKKHYRSYLKFFVSTRRTIFSGWWVENFLGIPLGEWTRYFFDKMRHHTAPDVKFNRLHKFRMYRTRQKFKLMQMEAFHFEKLRIRLYRESLKNWENFTEKSIKFLAPNKKKHYLYTTVKQFKRETREWTVLGDWAKFFWKPEPTPEKGAYFFDYLQVSLSHLIDKFVNRRGRKRIRRNLWRTIQHIPGHLSMPYYPKIWYSRFNNTFLFYPSVTTRYNYNYYNYIGWRDNRARWRRYAFTPGNVIDKVFEHNRGLQRRDYNFYKRWQKRRRLMRVFQF